MTLSDSELVKLYSSDLIRFCNTAESEVPCIFVFIQKKGMEKLWKNYGKIMEKLRENYGKISILCKTILPSGTDTTGT